MEICKLRAFQRIYSMLSKKNLTLFGILTMFFIMFFNIPFKFLQLCYYFIFQNKESFREGLIILYYQSYYLFKKCKIEILNGKIYLNCMNLAKFFHALGPKDKISIEMYLKTIHRLQELNLKFYKYELARREFVQLFLAKGSINKTPLFGFHYTHAELGNSIHGTTNIPSQLSSEQKISPAMPSLIKENAKKPGSVISKNVELFTLKKSIIIPKQELNAIKYINKEHFDLTIEDLKYQEEKMLAYQYVLDTELRGIPQYGILDDLVSNQYTLLLMSAGDEELIKEIELFKFPISKDL